MTGGQFVGSAEGSPHFETRLRKPVQPSRLSVIITNHWKAVMDGSGGTRTVPWQPPRRG